ncbi:MAG: amidohydrolase family protein [Acidobacteriota bacterium]
MPNATVLTAKWLLPIDRPPIHNGWIEVTNGRIGRFGGGPPPAAARELGDVAVLPGLVNAHTHLELSWLAGRIPPADSMVDWIVSLIAERAAGVNVSAGERLEDMRDAVAAMKATGTVLVGDVSNSLASAAVLRDADMGGVLFHELLGFSVTEPSELVRGGWTHAEDAVTGAPELHPSVVAHAPYSVSPALFSEIAARRRRAPLSVHVAESAEELEFLQSGRGRFRGLLDQLGVWNDRWPIPDCDPIEFLRRVGYLQPGVLAVHGVHLKESGLERLRDAGGVVVTCPRSNEWVGGGLPQVSRFYASGVRVAIGTDSLASTPTLNLFDELAQLRRIAPDVAAGSLLESATRVGADALGFGHEYGTIAPGKRAALIAVRIPPGVNDVEEYLVSGVPASSVDPVLPS